MQMSFTKLLKRKRTKTKTTINGC